ncbi:MAG: quinone-dependent dihydroorotate dehydrogenase [Aquimonas sp.]|nr:quinone-dependent dihydroorotate dehydrogenase [Aquimonas sp.]
MYTFARPFLMLMDAERAHDLALSGLSAMYRLGLNPLIAQRSKPLPVKLWDLEFPNPVGLAAGLDKNGEHIDALGALGFGHLEIGTTTPRPQAGNPKPRMFRLTRHGAVINRMGFNNQGVNALLANVERSRYRGVLGINISKNKDTPNERAFEDYLYCLERVFPVASYVTVNISSPNTAGLRDLQSADELHRLLGQLRDAQERLAAKHRRRTPIVVKVAPDLSDQQIERMGLVLAAARVDGVIATNTTVDRLPVQGHPHAEEAGGLSGKPLYGRSTRVLRHLRSHLPDSIPIIGVGGVHSGADAVGKITAGAALVQIYTGFIYRGPILIRQCVEAIRRRREQPVRGMSR